LRILRTFLLVLLGCAASFAQEHPNVTASTNTVFVGADGKFESAPDTATIDFNISVQEGNAKAAYDHAATIAEQVRQILRSNGIEPKTAEIGYFSLQPVYDWKNPKRKLVGYNVNASVSLKLKDFAKVGPIVQALSDTEVSETASVRYTLDNIDSAKNKAVEDAYRRARESADTIARASGRMIGELSYASVDISENIRPVPLVHNAMRMSAQAQEAPTEEFSPQNTIITAHVNAMFTLK
jgi:uncharacterized protein YggE